LFLDFSIFGAFLMRYRVDLVLSYSFIAVAMAIYFGLARKRDSPAEHPEKLDREGKSIIRITHRALHRLRLCSGGGP
jgi:hypothetical protein